MGLGVKLTGAPDEAAARRDRLPFPLRTIHVCIFFLSFSFKFTIPQIAQSSTAVAVLTLSILSQMARLDSATDPRFWTLFDDAGGKELDISSRFRVGEKLADDIWSAMKIIDRGHP